MNKSVGKKIGSKLHTSSRYARNYFPILKELGKKYSQEIMDFYELDEDEMAFILGTSVSKLKRQK
jgi:hypothetical protein